MTVKHTPNWLLLGAAIAGGALFLAFVALTAAGDVTIAPIAFLATVGALTVCTLLALGFRRGSAATEPALSARIPGRSRFGESAAAAGIIGAGRAGVEAGVPGADTEPADPVNSREPSRPSFAGVPCQGMTEKAPASDPHRSPREGADRNVAKEQAAASMPSGPSGAAGARIEPRAAPEGEQTPRARDGGSDGQGTADVRPAAAGDAAAISAGGKGRSEGIIGVEPARLNEARDGGRDDLKRIKGVGPKLEVMLHHLGIFHDQIAGWTDKEAAWIDENLQDARGRDIRDGWVEQARRLVPEKHNTGSGRAGVVGATS